MLRIQRRFVEQVHAARSGADLYNLIQGAIRLEHATIPPYLTAMLSFQPGTNLEIWSIIHSVVIDEMLHMTIACNLLNALGCKPVIDDQRFVPDYPGPLPFGIASGLKVGLKAFSIDLVNNVFMKIEESEDRNVYPVLTAEMALTEFATIGQFYRALIAKIRELGPSIFLGEPSRQVVADEWFAAERLFPITGVQSAVKALEIIVEEGEGTKTSPLSGGKDFAHCYRFEQISRLARLVLGPNGYSFSGAVLPFDATKVYALTPNQKLADLDANSEGARRAKQFAFVYTKLLKALQRVFDGEPGTFNTTIGLMYELKIAGQILCELPAIKNGAKTGLNVGPTFFYEVVEKADQLSRRARDYVTYHDLSTSEICDGTMGEDVDRLRVVREALAGFRSAVERSQPNSRVRTLGLA